MSKKNVYETTLRLHDINHLFDEPDISPFSDYYEPYSFKAGMDASSTSCTATRRQSRLN